MKSYGTGPDTIRPEHLKSLPPVLINTLARLFTRYLSECKVPKQWKTSKTVLLYKKGNPHDIGVAQSAYCPTIDHIHIVSKLIEISREYKVPLCLTFIDLKKAFDSVETEAVVEALDNQGVPPLYIKVLRELHSNVTTEISPFYKNIIIDVKRGVRQGVTISPKIFSATRENAVRKLDWYDVGVKVDGRQLHHLHFADDIVLITPSINQAERMLTELAVAVSYVNDRRLETPQRLPRKVKSGHYRKTANPTVRFLHEVLQKKMMFFVSNAKEGTTGLLWHAIGANGKITGSRSTSSKINGSQGDQGDTNMTHIREHRSAFFIVQT
ncbi:hypothetical protein RB195_013601 [Necator americanus]|uniref:Reverse transcriptase domain-containing protein n=1 Tax=Necator americanus TaxID=51031 RepID=A0ABR1DWD9_NECAM